MLRGSVASVLVRAHNTVCIPFHSVHTIGLCARLATHCLRPRPVRFLSHAAALKKVILFAMTELFGALVYEKDAYLI